MRRLVLTAFLVLVLGALVWAAGGAEQTARTAPEAEQAIRVAPQFFSGDNEGDLASIDPARRGTWSFHSLIWAPLVAGDTAGNFLPERSLATGWDISDDGTVYRFRLREARFSDGTPITAQNVVDSFGHYGMMLHAEASGYRSNFSIARRLLPDIVGLMEFPSLYPYDEFGIGGPIEGIRAIDDRTVEIELEAESVTFIRRLMVTFSVFKADDLLAGKTARYDLMDYWTGNAAASGPYRIVRAVPGERVVLERNEHYFGPSPQLDRITMLAVARDVNTILTAYQNNELDVVAIPLTGDAARQAMGDPRLSEDLVQVPTWQVTQMWVTPNEPLDDVLVRRAFSMAIDRATLVRILNGGAPQPLYETVNMHRNPAVPDAVEETAAVTMLPFDPAAARRELEQSRYWPQVLDMEINLYAPNPGDVPLMETVQRMLTENLGLRKVTIHNQRISDMMNPPFPLHLWPNAQMPWFADVIDTIKNMAWMVPDRPWQSGDHRPFIAVAYEPEMRRLTDEAFGENDPARRAELVGQIGQLWNDVAFSLDYAIPVAYFLVKPHVTGFEWYQNAGQGMPLYIERVRVE